MKMIANIDYRITGGGDCLEVSYRQGIDDPHKRLDEVMMYLGTTWADYRRAICTPASLWKFMAPKRNRRK